MHFKDLPRCPAEDAKREIDPAGVKFPVDFDLRSPIAVDGKNLDTATVREPTVADLERADEAGSRGHAKMIHLLADLAGLAPSDIRALSAADYKDMSDTVACFL